MTSSCLEDSYQGGSSMTCKRLAADRKYYPCPLRARKRCVAGRPLQWEKSSARSVVFLSTPFRRSACFQKSGDPRTRTMLTMRMMRFRRLVGSRLSRSRQMLVQTATMFHTCRKISQLLLRLFYPLASDVRLLRTFKEGVV